MFDELTPSANREDRRYSHGDPLSNNAHGKLADHKSDEADLDEVLEEFTERCRLGQRVCVEEYAARYPELAEQIRELFPTVMAMERFNVAKHSSQMSGNHEPMPRIEQLGDYRVLGEIARGGMGIVYEAEQVTLGRRVAVKVLPKQMLRSEKDVQRFQREAQTAAKLHHANIVPVFGVGHQDGVHYLVMQLIRGVGLDEILSELKRKVVDWDDSNSPARPATARSSCIHRSATLLLSERLRTDSRGRQSAANETRALHRSSEETIASPDLTPNHNDNSSDNLPSISRISADRLLRPAADKTTGRISHLRTPLDPEYFRNVARIGLQAAEALGYAHRHDTLHRDIKPGNLLLDDEGVVWIADFGLAKAIEQEGVTWTGDIVGTLSYMAPERFDGTANASSDIYSLGLTLHEMLTFERAFDGRDRASLMNRILNDPLTPPRKVNLGVPHDLETIVLKAAAKKPADRYATADELAEDLQRFLADRPIRARRVGGIEHALRWCRRNRTITTLAATVLVLLATVLAVTSTGYVRETTQRQRAETTSQLAIKALDEIYTQFAPPQINIGVSSPTSDEDSLLDHAQLPLSKDVALLLENLLRFYDELSHQANNSGSVTYKAIVANRRVGDIHRRLGDLDRSRDAYTRALAQIDTLSPELKSSPEAKLEWGRIHNGLGIVFHQTRHFSQALDAHRQAREQLSGGIVSPAHQFETARALYLSHIAQADSRRQRHATTEEFSADELKEAIRILLALRDQYPHETQYQSLLASCYLETADNAELSPTLSANQREALAIFEALVQKAPEASDYRYQLGEAYESLEWPRICSSRCEVTPREILLESETRLRRALDVTAPLEASHAQICQFHVLRKQLHHHLAKVLEQLDQKEESLASYVLAIEKQRAVIEHSQHPHFHQVFLHDLQLDYARLLRDSERYDQAETLLESMSLELSALMELPEVRKHDHMRRKAKDVLYQTQGALCCLLNQVGKQADADKILRQAEQSR